MTISADNKIYLEVADDLGIHEKSGWGKRVFNQKYSRFNEEQKAQWDAVYGPINEEFAEMYPQMGSTELMKWKYQRYMQDYLGCIASVDENVGRVLDYFEESGLSAITIYEERGISNPVN